MRMIGRSRSRFQFILAKEPNTPGLNGDDEIFFLVYQGGYRAKRRTKRTQQRLQKFQKKKPIKTLSKRSSK